MQFIDTHCSSKREFYAKTGISRGTLESNTGISEDTFTKIFATYQNLSPSWVLLGIGEKEIVPSEMSNHANSEVINDSGECKSCVEKERIIESQKETILALKEAVLALKAKEIFLQGENFDTGLNPGGQKRKAG